MPPPKPGAVVPAVAATPHQQQRKEDTNTSPGQAPLPFLFAAVPQGVEGSAATELERVLSGHSLPAIGFFRHSKIYANGREQFFLGANGTGAPMHFHTHALNMLVYGRKQWFAIQPRFEATYRGDIRTWAEEGKHKYLQQGIEVQECIQEQGDVLYIPEHWTHGVLNLAESVGIATEFDLRELPPIVPAKPVGSLPDGFGGEAITGRQLPAAAHPHAPPLLPPGFGPGAGGSKATQKGQQTAPARTEL